MSARNQQGAFLLACIATLVVVSGSHAASMNYGDLMGDNVWYRQVEEQNAEPELLYSAPTVAGDTLEFDPVNFLAQSPDGGGAEIVDSQMSMIIEAKPTKGITSLAISEAGDYTLVGLPGAVAEAAVGAAFFWTITGINNVAVAGPSGTANMQFTTGGGPNGGEFELPGDAGASVIWRGSVLLDFAGALNPGERVTEVEVTFDNSLSALADAGGAAFIKKKNIGGIIVTPNMIPEPSTILLSLLGLASVVAIARRRS